MVRASGRGELHRKTGLPHESHHSKDEVWKEGRCRLTGAASFQIVLEKKKTNQRKEALRSVC